MNFNGKCIAIPEIDFADYCDIMGIDVLEDRKDDTLEDIKLNIIFNMGTKEMYDRFIDGMLYLQNKIEEIIVFLDNYQKLVVYKDCVLSSMNIRLKEEPTFRARSGHSLGGNNIQNYILDVSFYCRTSQKMDAKLFSRHKKLEGIIKMIKDVKK